MIRRYILASNTSFWRDVKTNFLLVTLCILLLASLRVNAGQDRRSPLLDYNYHNNLIWNIGSRHSKDNLDYFNRPISFLQSPIKISMLYSANNIIDRDAVNFNSKATELFGVYQPGNFIPLNTVFAFSIAQVSDKFERREVEDEVYIIKQSRQSYNFALSTEVSSFLNIGVGSMLREKKRLTSYDIDLKTTPYLTTRYSVFTPQENFLLKYQVSNNESTFNYKPFTKVSELEFRAILPNVANIRFAFDPRNSTNNGLRIRSKYFKKVTFLFEQSRLSSSRVSSIFFDGQSGNELIYNSKYEKTRYAFQYFPTVRTKLSFSYVRKTWLADVEGEIDSRVVPFLTSLFVIDDRNFNADLAWREKDYLVEYETQVSKRYLIKASLEFINLKPSANLTHWISPPLLSVIKLDKETTKLALQELNILRISVGTRVSYKSIVSSLTVGQMMPIQLTYSETGRQKNYSLGTGDIKSIADRFKGGIEGYSIDFQVDYLF